MPPDYDFDELYPGRFIKGGMFKGKAVTLTISDLTREEFPDAKGKNGKAFKVVLSFKERDKQVIANKLNCTALMLMFGRKTSGWLGKRVTFYGEKGTWFGKKHEAIRIYGSPDIAKDIDESVRLGLDNYEYHLRKVDLSKKGITPTPPAPVPEPELDVDTGEVPFDEEEQAQIRAEEMRAAGS